MKNTNQMYSLQFRKIHRDVENWDNVAFLHSIPVQPWASQLIEEHWLKMKAAVLTIPTQLVSNPEDGYVF